MANMNLKLEELNALSDEIITKVDEWVKNHPNATAEEVIEASVRIGMACGLDHSDDIVQIDNPEEFQKEAEKALKDAGIKTKEISTKTLAAIATSAKEESIKEKSFMDKVWDNKWKILIGVVAVGAAAGTAYYYRDEIKDLADKYFPEDEDEFILTEE
nr:MAG TPA: hypothetical protein [Caudoviricetes sp.]